MNRPQPLPESDFFRSFELVPRVAVCLQVRGLGGSVLLTQRSPAMAMAGEWHYPGAFLFKGETFAECAQRAALKELGVSIQGEPRFFGVFEDLDGDPRGHVIDVVLEVDLAEAPRPTDESSALAFFDHVPGNLPFHHDRILRAAGLSEANR